MTKTKIKIVGDLITTSIYQKTVSYVQVFKIFKPYIEFAEIDHSPLYEYIDFDDSSFETTKNGITVCYREKGLIKFKIHKHIVKKKRIRGFRINSKLQYSVWMSNSFDNYKNHIKTKILFQHGITDKISSHLEMYHFLREMKKVVPTCINDLEKLMFMNL